MRTRGRSEIVAATDELPKRDTPRLVHLSDSGRSTGSRGLRAPPSQARLTQWHVARAAFELPNATRLPLRGQHRHRTCFPFHLAFEVTNWRHPKRMPQVTPDGQRALQRAHRNTLEAPPKRKGERSRAVRGIVQRKCQTTFRVPC